MENRENTEPVISVRKLNLRFKDNQVLKDVSADFYQGIIYGIIGRNGSGKTVLLKNMIGVLSPDSGTVSVRQKVVGKDIDFPDHTGFIIETPGFFMNCSGYKNLKYLASIRGIAGEKEVRHAMEVVGLDPDEKKHVGRYSLGMRQRLGIAQAIMEDPDILILDEPMNSLDEQGVEDMRALFLSLKAKGKLLIITSHYKEDIEALCDVVYRMSRGVLTEASVEG